MKKTLKFLGYDIELIDLYLTTPHPPPPPSLSLLKKDPERPIINKKAEWW